MYITRLLIIVAAIFLFANTRAARACPACADAVPATSGAEAEDAMREAQAYNNSIYVMAGMPYLLFGGVSVWVYRGLRRKALAEQQFMAEERS
jgi:hypothetical protein